MKKIPILKVILYLLLFLIIFKLTQVQSQSPDYSYNVGDSFSLNIHTHLDGTSGLYSGYTEDEIDIRTYTITNIEGNLVTWSMVSDFTYRDSDGGWLSTKETYQFITDAFTREYYFGTIDGPDINRNYYTFDVIWFRIDPNLAVGSNIHILGGTYTLEEKTITNTDIFKGFNTLKVESKINPTKRISDPQNEYDPRGYFSLATLKDDYYFDQNTGYIIKNDWRAHGVTSNGDFYWTDSIILTNSTFEVSSNFFASYQLIFYLIGLVIISLLFIHLFYQFLKYLWRKQVTNAIGIITGTGSPPISTGNAPTIWDPLNVDYKVLLRNLDSENNHGLMDGVYVITDTESRLALVDTKTTEPSPNKLFLLNDKNLIYLYQLALGCADPSSSIYTNEIGQKGGKSKGFGVVDQEALNLFMRNPHAASKEYIEIAYLLARRRVLDYSHGQAPLSPSSHLRKLHEILKFKPKEVLLVGDDDLISVSLARRGIEVFTIEIDPYTCALIQGIADGEDLPITIFQHDLRESLPSVINRKFELFVADPDFTIEAFTLFLTRGMSMLKLNGRGLINFQNSRAQIYRARYLLEELNVPILEQLPERWNYVILANKRVATRSVYSGKYTHVIYSDYIELREPSYSSIMFQIERNDNSIVLLNKDEKFTGLPESIYDY